MANVKWHHYFFKVGFELCFYPQNCPFLNVKTGFQILTQLLRNYVSLGF